ncbi:STAS domain-containing protein [Actinomadura sp. 9N407]|uniref:STAS domain-containing protein n=1 Tax=Actinomadura sp. 9N407 TaxID=3375154 RepID=UPI00378FD129
MNLHAARVPESAATAVITFPAEVDLSNAGDILAQALRLVRAGTPGVVFDLTACTFCDSSGPNIIFRTRARTEAARVPLVVVLPERGIVRKICDIAGVTRDIDVAPDLESARTRIRAAGG